MILHNFQSEKWQSPTTRSDVIWAFTMLECGTPINEICKTLTISRRRLFRLLRRLGLKEPPCRIVAPPYQTPNNLSDIAYIAGLFDGDGAIHKPRKVHWFNYMISVTNTHKETVDWLSGFGGSVIAVKKRRFHKRQQYVWRIMNKKGVISFLQDVLPYLIIKKDRASLVIERLKIHNEEL